MASIRKSARTRTELTRLWVQALETRDTPAPIAFSVRSDGDDRLYQIDLGTGSISPISPATGVSATERNIEALAFNPTNFLLYGLDDGTGDLVTVDTFTGLATKVAATGVPTNGNPGMAFDQNGTLYVVTDNDGQQPNARNQRGNLYRVDPNTGLTTVVGPLGRGLQGLAIASNGVLYGVDEVNNVLVKVNPASGATTVVGKTGIFPNFPAGILGTGSADNGTAPDIGSDIAFDNAGTLYGIDDDAGIFQLNKVTGAGSVSASSVTLFESLAISPFSTFGNPGAPIPPIPLPPPATAVPLPGTPSIPAGASVASSIVFTNPVGASLVNRSTGASTPITPPFTGVQANTAVADLTGDGTPDVVYVPGVGGGPVVFVTDGTTGAVVRTILAFDPNYRGGLSVAAGDVTGDGRADIVVSILSNGGPAVRVFDGVTGGLVASFFAFDPGYTGGVNVAVGDVTGDGRADIVASTAGAGGGGRVEVIDGTLLGRVASRGAVTDADLVGGAGFVPLPGFLGGINVAAGDFDGDGYVDLAVTPGGGGGPVVLTYSGRALAAGDTSRRSAFTAAGFEGFFGGLSVAAVDLTGDGRAEVVVTPQFGGGPLVRGYDPVTGRVVLSTTAGNPTDRGGGDVS